GLVGSALWRELQRQGYTNLVGKTRDELDLMNTQAVNLFFENERPEFVFLAAAKVGGILANSKYPVDFLQDNLKIQLNIIEAAYKYGVKKLLFLGSSCIYPKYAPQPMKEEYLLTGALEPTNEWYAIAKIAGLKLCQAYRRQYGCNFISVMPTNLYGINDNYHPSDSHVLPAMIRRFYEAKESGTESVTCWGTGTPRREFLYVDDLANACLFLMNNYNDEQIINIGCGYDITIKELSEIVADVIGYNGKINWDTSKPDGTPRKLLDCSRIFSMGWRPKYDLKTGVKLAFEDFLKRYKTSSFEKGRF
ncbi:MAG TPA: GDP-L-fucose synthase, partial [Verrucomicrobiota bacterium]|nr:GDP-L-fucose synthase [Verrucomicrobiota bacterium]